MRNLINNLKGKKVSKKLISIMLSVLIAFTFVTGYFISVSDASTVAVSSLQIGDTINLGRVGDLELVWRVVGYDENCSTTGTNPFIVLDNYQDLTYYKGLRFDYPHTSSNGKYNISGSNVWKYSTLRKLLNSDQDAAHVVYTDDGAYYSGNGYNLNGFLHDFTSLEKSMILNTTHENFVDENTPTSERVGTTFYPNDDQYKKLVMARTISETLYNSYFHQTTTEKVFLMSAREISLAQNQGGGHGFVWSDGNVDGKHYYMLRDASSTGWYNPYYIKYIHYNNYTNLNGKSHYIDSIAVDGSETANADVYIRPACVLDGSQSLQLVTEGNYSVPKPSIEDADLEGLADEILFDGTKKKQSGYTLSYNGTALTESIIVGDKNASVLNLGDIVTLGKLNGHDLKWRVVGFGENAEADKSKGNPYLVLDNYDDTELSSYMSMPFDKQHTGDTSNRNSNGSNNWDSSTIKKWLNSDQANGSVDYNHDFYTGNQNAYEGMDGFLHEFTEYEKNALVNATHKTIVADGDPNDGGSVKHSITTTGVPTAWLGSNYDTTAYFKNTTEKVFLMGLKEIANAYTNRNESGFIFYKAGYPIYWLRDANAARTDSTIYVIDTSKCGTTYSAYLVGIRPAVMLNSDTALVSLQDSSGANYKVGSIEENDFKVSYSGDLTGPGEVTMTFTGCGSYGGTKTFTYNIIKKSMNDVEVTGIEDSLYYDGTPKKQSGYVLKDKDGKTLTEVLGDGDTDATKLKLGDIVTLGKLGGHPLKWRVVGFDEDCLETGTNPYLILENYTDTELSAYTGFEFDPKHDDTDSAVYARDGYNNWSASTLRKWYNSSDTTIDYSHDHYANVDPYGKPGFLHEFEDYEAGAIKPVTHKYVVESFEEHGSNGTAKHIRKDQRLSETGLDHPLQNYETAYYQTCEDKVFASNILEISNAYKWKGTSGYEYSGDAVYWLRDEKCYDEDTLTASQTRWVRKHETYVEGVVDGSNPYTDGAYLSLRPALVLKAETSLKTLESGKYQVAQPGVGEYTVSYSRTNGDSSDLTSPGEIKITFTGAGSYGGTKTVTYNIVKKSMDDVVVSGIEDKLYTGEPCPQGDFTITYNGDPLISESLDGDVNVSDLNLGDTVKLGRLGEVELEWMVIGFGPNCESDKSKGAPYLTLNNWNSSALSGYRTLYFDWRRQDNPAIGDRNTNGSNEWSTSQIRSWLNSDKVGSEIPYTHKYNGTTPWGGLNGFLRDFTEDEKNAIADTTHRNIVTNKDPRYCGSYSYTYKSTDTPTAIAKNYDSYYAQKTTDKVFFMNTKELNNAINNSSNNHFEWKNSTYGYFLRDASYESSQQKFDKVLYVASGTATTMGQLTASSTSGIALRPALMLRSDIKLKQLGDSTYGKEYRAGQTVLADYKVTYSRQNGDSSDLINPGEITMTITGTGAFEGTITKKYNIYKKPMENVVITGIENKLYNGEPQPQTDFTIKYNGDSLTAGTFDGDVNVSELNLGDTVKLGRLDGTDLEWMVIGFGTDCEADKSKGAPYLALINYADEGLIRYYDMNFTQSHQNDSVANRNSYGSNEWSTSQIRTWLNSDKIASEIPYTYIYGTVIPYNSLDGFLKDFTEFEKNAIAFTTHKSHVSSVDNHDGGTKELVYANATPSVAASEYNDYYYQNTTEQVFLMNTIEVNNADANSLNHWDFNIPYDYYLRDASDGVYSVRFHVTNSGTLTREEANQSNSVGYTKINRLALILNSDAKLKKLGTSTYGNEYRVGQIAPSDYEVTYSRKNGDSSDLTSPGEITMTFTGTGAFEGSKEVTYYILSNEVDTDDITIEISDEINFTGSEINLTSDDITVKIKSGEEDIVIGPENYTITGYSEDHTNAGEASVTIKLSGIFDSDPVTKKFTINPVALTSNDLITMPNLQQDLVYTGSSLNPTGQEVYWNEVLLDASNYTLTVSDNVNAGSGKVTVTGKGNFSGSKEFTFPIGTKDITSNSNITISDIEDKEITGSQIEPEFTIYDGDILVSSNPKVLTLNSDYTATFGDNNSLGDGTITITGCGNYSGSKTFTFTICGAKVEDNEVTVEIEDSGLIFDGTAKTPTYVVKVNGTTITSSDYELVKYDNNVNATTSSSKAELVIRLKNNYSCDNDIVRYFDISPLSITDNASITMPNVNADNFKYTGSSLTPSDMTVKWNSNTLTDNDYTISVTDNVDAGTAKVTVTGKNNFTGSKVFNFTIGKRSFEDDTIEYFVPDEEYQSGVQIKPTSFTVKDSTIDRNLVLGTDYSIDPDGYGANNIKGDNSGSITITGGGNFEGTKVLYFNIVGAKINDLSKITATLDDSDLIFTGDALTPSDKITVSLDGVGVLTSDDWEVVGASWTNNTNAGNASVKVKLKGNYSSDPVTINFTIKQKELDITDFAFSGSGVATKEVTLKSEYSDVVPTSEQAKLLVKYGDVVLNFTSAKFKGISASDNPMKFGNCAITLSGLSLSDTNYKLKDTFTSFEVDSTHGLIVDKIKPELLSAFVTILDGTYKTGDMIYIELNYDKDISLNGNDPKLEFYSNVLADGKIGTLEVNKYKAKALYDSISGNKVKFKYEVKEGDYLPNGFTFALSGIINFESLVDSNGNAVNYSNETKRFDNVIVLSKSGVFDEIKKLIEGNDTNKESKILDILKDDDKTDLIFDTEPDLKSKIGSGASNDDARRKAAEYLAKSEDLDLSDISKLLDEIKRALHAKELEDEIKAKLDSQTPPTKEEIDDMMIKYQKLSSNEKKVFDSNLKTRLEELYYANLTADWKYKDNPSGEANEIEMYGIVSRTSAAIGKAVKLKVERIYDNARINELQGMVEANPGSTGERIIAPYDIILVDSDDVPVTIPGENVLCKIELPVGYYGKVINIYHKVDDTHIETVQNKLIQKIGDKCLVYFDCDSFSPYFMTSDAVSVKASLDPESTEGTVSPLGLFTVNQGENKDFIFTKSGETNRVDIALSKFNNQTKTFDLISGIDPINLFNTSKYTLKNITTNMFITFKLSHDDNFKKSGGSSGGGGGGGGGGSTPKPQEPVVPVPPAQPEKEFEVFNAYMKGYEDGTFGPQLNMTRAEAATIIARISEDFSEDANFTEISKSYKDYNSRHWANNYIGYVTEVGIMCGDEEGFRPDDKITRGEFSKLIYKLLNLENANLAIVKTFDDCKGQFYETYANALYSAGILTGYEDGTFNGSGKLTRTEAAIMINKATGRGLDKEETLKAIKESKDFKEFKDVSSNRWFYFDDMMATVSYSLEKETDQTLVDNPKKD